MPRYPFQPSVITVAPGWMFSVMKGCSVAAEASSITAIRHRPKPFGGVTSTAMQTSDFLPQARPPVRPGS